MFKRFRRWLLKKIYKFCIFRVVVLDKDKNPWINNLKVFCQVRILTDHGPFVFIFKKDRRHRDSEILTIENFIVELDVPENIKLTQTHLKTKFIMVVKVILLKIDPEILAEVLMDIYIKTLINLHSKDNPYGKKVVHIYKR
jgi:hypothetical protein